MILYSGFYTSNSWLYYGNIDWDITYSYAEFARKNILEYGQIPAWNPYVLGGTDFYSNLQNFHFGIFFPLVLIFGTIIGMKLQIIAFYLLGFWGMYRFLRVIYINSVYAFWGSALFCFSTYFAWHGIYSGHHNSMVIQSLPWWLYSYESFKRNNFRYKCWHAAIPILIFCNLVLDGASYPLLYTPLVFGSYALADGIANKKLLATLQFVIITTIAGLGIASFKLIPAIIYLSDFPREFLDKTFANPMNFLHMLADSKLLNKEDSISYWHWSEYGAAFSIVAVVFIVYYYKKLKWSLPLWIFLLFWIWLSLGNFPRYFNPWYYLNLYAPGFQSIRVPSRITIYLILFLVPAFLTILQRIKIQRKIVYIILSALLLHLYIQNRSIYLSWELSEALVNIDIESRQNQGFKWVKIPVSEEGKQGKMLPYIKNNLGILNGIEPTHMDTALFVKEEEEAQLIKENFVNIGYWSPNKMHLTLKVLKPFTLNQNFHPNWKEEWNNAEIIEEKGAMKVIPKAKSLHLKFHPPYLKSGLIISSVFAIGVLVWLSFLYRHK